MINIRDMKLSNNVIRSIVNTEHCLFITCMDESNYVYVKEFSLILNVNDDSMIHDEDGEMLTYFIPDAPDGISKLIYNRIKEKYADTIV